MLVRLTLPLLHLSAPPPVVRTRLRALEQAGGAYGPQLAAALQQARTGAYAPEEQEALRRIEVLRVRLRASDASVEMTDYGAGRTMRPSDTDTVSVRRVASLVRAASCPPKWCRFIFSLVRSVRPSHCLELGTHLGISGLAAASALRLNGAGSLTTIEGSPALSRYAQEHFAAFGLGNTRFLTGRFADTLPSLLSSTPGGFDCVFVDGHHAYDATAAYFRMLRDALPRPCLMLFDDIRWSAGMHRAWREVSSDAAVTLSIDLGAMGLVVCGPATPAPVRLTIPY